MSASVRPRISVINDNPEFLELMSAILEDDAGYDVELHGGEDLSIERLRRSRPDLIIVDLLLGGASGWEIVSLARSDAELAGVPIIVCSADVAQLRERAGELERIGNMYVMAKPFGIDQLIELVESLVGGGRSASVPAASG